MDKHIMCVDCQVTFVFEEKEQEFFKEKGFQEQVRDAQRETNSWSASRKEAVQLEGRANYDRVVKRDSDVPTKTRYRVPSSNKR